MNLATTNVGFVLVFLGLLIAVIVIILEEFK